MTGKLEILVADDDSAIRFVFKKMVEVAAISHGAEANVTVVEDGNSAIDMASQNSYDVIFSDYQMGETNGIQVYKSLSDQHKQRIVLMSANTLDLEEELEKAGISRPYPNIISKPFMIADIAKAIRPYIK